MYSQYHSSNSVLWETCPIMAIAKIYISFQRISVDLITYDSTHSICFVLSNTLIHFSPGDVFLSGSSFPYRIR